MSKFERNRNSYGRGDNMKEKSTDNNGIEKNIPVPSNGISKYGFHIFEIGDSKYFEDYNVAYKTVYVSAQQFGRRNDKKFSGRKEGTGLRIWRIK